MTRAMPNSEVPTSAAAAAAIRAAQAPRIAIEHIAPSVDGGRFNTKGVVGQLIAVSADIFVDGHDQLAARVVWQAQGDRDWQATAMAAAGNDRWTGSFVPTRTGPHRFVIEAWIASWASFRSELTKNIAPACRPCWRSRKAGAG